MKVRAFILAILCVGKFIAISPAPCVAQSTGATVESITANLERLETGTPAEQHKAAQQLYQVVRRRSSGFKELIDTKVLPALEQKYRTSTDGQVRSMAIHALAEAKSEKTIPALIDSLKDRDVGIQLRALNSLQRFGPNAKEAIPTLIEGIKNDALRHEAYATLMAVQGPDANETLIPLLTPRLQDEHKRTDLAGALAMHPDPRAVDFMEEVLFSDSIDGPNRAAKYFCRLGDRSPETIRVLRKCLSLTAPRSAERYINELRGVSKPEYRNEVRQQAIRYLASINDTASIDRIREILVNDPSLNVRIEAATALGTFKDSQSIRLLLQRLKDGDHAFDVYGPPDRSMHRAVVAALAEIGTKEALQALFDGIFIEESRVKNQQRCVGFWTRSTDETHLKFFVDAHSAKPLPGDLAASVLQSLLWRAGTTIRLAGDEAEAAKREFLLTVRDETHFENGAPRPSHANTRVEAQYLFYSNGLATVSLMFSSRVGTGHGYSVVYRKIGDRWVPIGQAGRWVS